MNVISRRWNLRTKRTALSFWATPQGSNSTPSGLDCILPGDVHRRFHLRLMILGPFGTRHSAYSSAYAPLGERGAREGAFISRSGQGEGSCRALIVNNRVGQDTSLALGSIRGPPRDLTPHPLPSLCQRARWCRIHCCTRWQRPRFRRDPPRRHCLYKFRIPKCT